MPLLQHIVQELDRELDRLHQIRTIVAGLSRTPAVLRHLTETGAVPAPDAVVPQATAFEPPPKSGRAAGSKRAYRARQKPAELRALAVTVPSGPVVFYPERAAAPPEEAAPTEPVSLPERTVEQLEAESRSLAARWATSSVQ